MPAHRGSLDVAVTILYYLPLLPFLCTLRFRIVTKEIQRFLIKVLGSLVPFEGLPTFSSILSGFRGERRAGNDASERGDSPASLSRRHTNYLASFGHDLPNLSPLLFSQFLFLR